MEDRANELHFDSWRGVFEYREAAGDSSRHICGGSRSNHAMNLTEIAGLPAVVAARAAIRQRDAETVAEQVRITRIAAPSGAESARGDYVAGRFATMGLVDIVVDEVGNVIAALPGASSGPGPHGRPPAPAILSAHLDTIFPPETVVTPREENGRIFAPGITDNGRGLAALLRIAESLVDTGITTRQPIVFAATVGEEGLGDLRGVKHLFARESPYARAAAFVSLDGAGSARIVHRAIGARRLRVMISGPGGHSWGDRGVANPAHALGAAIGEIANLVVPGDESLAINVGRIGGGTSINAIPAEAWCEIDLRGDEEEALARIAAEAREAFESATRAAAEGGAWRTALECHVEQIGSRPCGEVSEDGALVRAAIAATRMVGERPELAASSTDANVPISLGIPAITIGAGGRGGGIHTLGEWFENHDGARGIERALLTILGAAGARKAGQTA